MSFKQQKVLVILPPGTPSNGGNWIHARRLKERLFACGWQMQLVYADHIQEADTDSVSIIHLYNAYRTGSLFFQSELYGFARETRVPIILTLTGTDVNEYLPDIKTREMTMKAMDLADHLIAIAPYAEKKLKQDFPQWLRKISLIPLSVQLITKGNLRRNQLGWAEDDVVFFLAAGLREVKNPLAAVEPLSRLHEIDSRVRFCIAGPRLETSVVKELQLALGKYSWMTDLGNLPHEKIGEILPLVDVVINTSRSEGLSHFLLEGMSCSKPALASKIEGNLDLVTQGVDGFLYEGEEECFHYARCLAEDETLRLKMGRAAQRKVLSCYHGEAETKKMHQLYSALCCTPWVQEVSLCKP